jgi:hypothetical protein
VGEGDEYHGIGTVSMGVIAVCVHWMHLDGAGYQN